MLKSLSVKNYALINNLHVDFQKGLSIITGETGAGKSILLGALSLVLGKRANSSLVNNKDAKCIVEAEFDIKNYQLKHFFEESDLDYEDITTLRREILPNGKSRAFVNDTPTTILVLSQLSDKLIDIHSQHETLQLAEKEFQFLIIDNIANNEDLLKKYSVELSHYKELTKELQLIETAQLKSKEEFEYNSFILDELIQAKLTIGELETLEEKLEKLSHFEEIKSVFSIAVEIAEEEQFGLKKLLLDYKNHIDKVAEYSNEYKQLADRINSIYIEFNDIVSEIEIEEEKIEYNPNEIEKLNERLQLIYMLQKKHNTSNIDELLKVKEKYELKVNNVLNAGENLSIKKEEIKSVENGLNNLAKKISENRKKAITIFLKKLHLILENLEMRNTVLDIKLDKNESFQYNGKDNLQVFISADRGSNFEFIKRAASGGEMSRIMLAVKLILSDYSKLPSIIFDEIDTGVSGEVSNKMVGLMDKMSKNMQVIAITHLPQIAAKGDHHFKVFKVEEKGLIKTNVKLLNQEERISEIAEMLDGKTTSKTAIEHARKLLN